MTTSGDSKMIRRFRKNKTKKSVKKDAKVKSDKKAKIKLPFGKSSKTKAEEKK